MLIGMLLLYILRGFRIFHDFWRQRVAFSPTPTLEQLVPLPDPNPVLLGAVERDVDLRTVEEAKKEGPLVLDADDTTALHAVKDIEPAPNSTKPREVEVGALPEALQQTLVMIPNGPPKTSDIEGEDENYVELSAEALLAALFDERALQDLEEIASRPDAQPLAAGGPEPSRSSNANVELSVQELIAALCDEDGLRALEEIAGTGADDEDVEAIAEKPNPFPSVLEKAESDQSVDSDLWAQMEQLEGQGATLQEQASQFVSLISNQKLAFEAEAANFYGEQFDSFWLELDESLCSGAEMMPQVQKLLNCFAPKGPAEHFYIGDEDKAFTGTSQGTAQGTVQGTAQGTAKWFYIGDGEDEEDEEDEGYQDDEDTDVPEMSLPWPMRHDARAAKNGIKMLQDKLIEACQKKSQLFT